MEIDIDKVEQNITAQTRGIMIVHLYGRMAYDERLDDICKSHDLILMEDCAQAQGCTFNGVKAGAIGRAAAHSFYPGKNLGAMGDAGAVTTNDTELASAIRALANYGSPKKYEFEYTGINSRMSEMDAAFSTSSCNTSTQKTRCASVWQTTTTTISTTRRCLCPHDFRTPTTSTTSFLSSVHAETSCRSTCSTAVCRHSYTTPYRHTSNAATRQRHGTPHSSPFLSQN